MKVQQANRPPAYRQLAENLKADIVSGRLRPGDRLPTEPQLCVSSGVSRSTVREALRLLASQHLITTTRGVTGGSFVAPPSTTALADTLSVGLKMLLSCGPVDGQQVFEARELIEVPAAVLAVSRATAADLRAMRAALFDPDGDSDGFHAVQRAFHHALVAASGNPVLSLLAEPLYAVHNESDLVRRAGGSFWSRVDAAHRAILAAIEARDEEAARRAAEAHLAHLRTTYLGIQLDASVTGWAGAAPPGR